MKLNFAVGSLFLGLEVASAIVGVSSSATAGSCFSVFAKGKRRQVVPLARLSSQGPQATPISTGTSPSNGDVSAADTQFEATKPGVEVTNEAIHQQTMGSQTIQAHMLVASSPNKDNEGESKVARALEGRPGGKEDTKEILENHIKLSQQGKFRYRFYEKPEESIEFVRKVVALSEDQAWIYDRAFEHAFLMGMNSEESFHFADQMIAEPQGHQMAFLHAMKDLHFDFFDARAYVDRIAELPESADYVAFNAVVFDHAVRVLGLTADQGYKYADALQKVNQSHSRLFSEAFEYALKDLEESFLGAIWYAKQLVGRPDGADYLAIHSSALRHARTLTAFDPEFSLKRCKVYADRVAELGSTPFSEEAFDHAFRNLRFNFNEAFTFALKFAALRLADPSVDAQHPSARSQANLYRTWVGRAKHGLVIAGKEMRAADCLSFGERISSIHGDPENFLKAFRYKVNEPDSVALNAIGIDPFLDFAERVQSRTDLATYFADHRNAVKYFSGLRRSGEENAREGNAKDAIVYADRVLDPNARPFHQGSFEFAIQELGFTLKLAFSFAETVQSSPHSDAYLAAFRYFFQRLRLTLDQAKNYAAEIQSRPDWEQYIQRHQVVYTHLSSLNLSLSVSGRMVRTVEATDRILQQQGGFEAFQEAVRNKTIATILKGECVDPILGTWGRTAANSKVFGSMAGSEAEALQNAAIVRRGNGQFQNETEIGGQRISFSSYIHADQLANINAYVIHDQKIADLLRVSVGAHLPDDGSLSAGQKEIIAEWIMDASKITYETMPGTHPDFASRQLRLDQQEYLNRLRAFIFEQRFGAPRGGPLNGLFRTVLTVSPDSVVSIYASAATWDEFSNLMDAIKDNDEEKFLNNIIVMANGFGRNQLAAAAAFVDTFSYLFIAKQFPSVGLRQNYFHYLLRCGSISSERN